MPNIKLIIVKGGSGYCSERLSIGVHVKNGIATLIDSGIDDNTAKAVDKMLKENNLTLGAIINTHSHADHCGGNSYFQKHYPDVQIYSTAHEKHFIEEPINEPRCFCQGAHPHDGLRNKFLEAKKSRVTHVIEPYEDQAIEINGERFTIVTLPGHTPGMVGVITPDNVFYAGDAIFGAETLAKHGVLFYTHIDDTLKSLQKIALLKVDACVFYHGGLSQENLAATVALHEARILANVELVHQIIARKPTCLDKLTQKVMQHYQLADTVTQYTLTETCVRAFLSHLEAHKKIEMRMQNGLMVAVNMDANLRSTQSPVLFKAVSATPKNDVCIADLSPESFAKWRANRK